MALKAFKANNNKVVIVSDRINKTVINLSKNSTHMLNIRAIKEPTFLIPIAKKTFNHLWLAFVKAPICQHVDLKNHIWIEIDVLGYAISRVLS